MWPNTQFSANLVTFTVEIILEKLHFLCGGNGYIYANLNIFFGNHAQSLHTSS